MFQRRTALESVLYVFSAAWLASCIDENNKCNTIHTVVFLAVRPPPGSCEQDRLQLSPTSVAATMAATEAHINTSYTCASKTRAAEPRGASLPDFGGRTPLASSSASRKRTTASWTTAPHTSPRPWPPCGRGYRVGPRIALPPSIFVPSSKAALTRPSWFQHVRDENARRKACAKKGKQPGHG